MLVATGVGTRVMMSAGNEAGDSELLTVPARNVTETELLQHGWVGRHLVFVEAAYNMLTLDLACHWIAKTTYLAAGSHIHHDESSKNSILSWCCNEEPAELYVNICPQSHSPRKTDHFSYLSPTSSRTRIRSQPSTGSRIRHDPILRQSVLDQGMKSQTLTGRQSVIRDDFQEGVLNINISRVLLRGLVAIAIASASASARSSRDSTSGTWGNAINHVELGSWAHGSQARHSLGVTGGQDARDPADRHVGRELVERDEGSQSTIWARAEELRTNWRSHFDVLVVGV